MITKKFNSVGFAVMLAAMILIAMPTQNLLAQTKSLQVYLPRNAAVSGEVVRLKDAGILKGDEETAAKAGDVALAKVSQPGQSVVIDKQTIMSRLASNGIAASVISFSGAESVVIERKGYLIKSEDFVKIAQQELEKDQQNSSCRWKVAWQPKEVFVDGTQADTKLAVKLSPNSTQSQARMLVTVLQDGKEVCVREVAFNIQYKNLRAVAITDIQPGTSMSADNVRIESFESALPQHGWTQPYGLAARRQIQAGSIIGADMLEAAKSPLLVSKNQAVVIQIKQPGLVITAMGEALDNARAKECIKVRNIDSQRILLARVNDDGSVEPVY